jgi:hypothetical protein
VTVLQVQQLEVVQHLHQHNSSSGSAPSTRNAGVAVARGRFDPTEVALRLQALQEQQLLEIAAQERALKERQAQEKKASARGNVHVRYIEAVNCKASSFSNAAVAAIAGIALLSCSSVVLQSRASRVVCDRHCLSGMG